MGTPCGNGTGRRALACLLLLMLALAAVSCARKTEDSAVLDIDEAAIYVEDAILINDRGILLDSEPILITDGDTLQRLWDLYASMSVRASGSRPLECPRFRVRFRKQGKDLFDWLLNREGMTAVSNGELGNCEIENIENPSSLYDAVSEIFCFQLDQLRMDSAVGQAAGQTGPALNQ